MVLDETNYFRKVKMDFMVKKSSAEGTNGLGLGGNKSSFLFASLHEGLMVMLSRDCRLNRQGDEQAGGKSAGAGYNNQVIIYDEIS